MTKREWKALNPTWKGPCLRAYVRRRSSWRAFRVHLVVNASTMFVKHALMQADKNQRTKNHD